MHEDLNVLSKVRSDSQKDVVCNCEIETQGTRLERNQHDFGVLAVAGRTVENLLHRWDCSRFPLSFNLPFLCLSLLYTGRDVFFKIIVVGVISNDEVRIIAIGDILIIV